MINEHKVYWYKGVDHGIELEQARVVSLLEAQHTMWEKAGLLDFAEVIYQALDLIRVSK